MSTLFYSTFNKSDLETGEVGVVLVRGNDLASAIITYLHKEMKMKILFHEDSASNYINMVLHNNLLEAPESSIPKHLY